MANSLPLPNKQVFSNPHQQQEEDEDDGGYDEDDQSGLKREQLLGPEGRRSQRFISASFRRDCLIKQQVLFGR